MEHEKTDCLACPKLEEAIVKHQREPDKPFKIMQKETIDELLRISSKTYPNGCYDKLDKQ